jgi:hypothetical protein
LSGCGSGGFVEKVAEKAVAASSLVQLLRCVEEVEQEALRQFADEPSLCDHVKSTQFVLTFNSVTPAKALLPPGGFCPREGTGVQLGFTLQDNAGRAVRVLKWGCAWIAGIDFNDRLTEHLTVCANGIRCCPADVESGIRHCAAIGGKIIATISSENPAVSPTFHVGAHVGPSRIGLSEACDQGDAPVFRWKENSNELS